MSLTKRTVAPSLEPRAYSASQMPEATPIGVPMAMARALITALPKKALSRPPASFGGGVIWVKRSRFRADMPRLTVVQTIQVRNTSPNRVARDDNTIAKALVPRRRSRRAWE